MMACNKGFTLIELLMVLMIIVVLLGIAAPSYYFLVTENRSNSEVNQLIAAVNFARSEATHRHVIVSICKSADGNGCNGEWKQGWIIFIDQQGTGNRTAQNKILRKNIVVAAGGDLQWSGQRSDDYLQMDPTGGTRGQAGTFTYIADVRHPQRYSKIIVSQTGRIRVENSL
jgi:type IV fimbrial biogenesis protein FimT